MKCRVKEEIQNDPFTEKIIAACFEVHKALGSGFNEKIYKKALKMALEENSFKCETEKNFIVRYKDRQVGNLIIDLIVDGKIVVEVKAVTDAMPKVFEHQIISYLKISGLKVGLLVNFGERSCQIRRFVY